MKRTLFYFLSALLFAGLISGCGSIKYVHRAQTSFDEAKAAGAEQKAPFEYYAAEEYLSLSEHENEEGDHSQTKIFASPRARASSSGVVPSLRTETVATRRSQAKRSVMP